MELLDLVNQQLTPNVRAQMADKVGLDRATLDELLPSAIALITKGLSDQTSGGGIKSLAGILDKDDLPETLEAVSGGDVGGLLGAVLGAKQLRAEEALNKLSGGQGQMKALLEMLTPIIMKQLANMSKAGGVAAQDLGSVVDKAHTRAEAELPGKLGNLAKVLDSDGDGSVMDDLAGIASKRRAWRLVRQKITRRAEPTGHQSTSE